MITCENAWRILCANTATPKEEEELCHHLKACHACQTTLDKAALAFEAEYGTVLAEIIEENPAWRTLRDEMRAKLGEKNK